MTNNSWMQGIVQGYTWKMKMCNDAIFEKWTPKDITRKEAREMMLRFSNGDFEIYQNSDVESLWKTTR